MAAEKMAKDPNFFSVNVQKGAGVKRMREKLSADRFKAKETKFGPTEDALLKKLGKKMPHSHPAKRDYDAELLTDLWAETTPAIVTKEMTI